MKILKDNIEITVETKLSQLREDLSRYTIDFSSIKYLSGEKKLLVLAFNDVRNESIKD